MAGQAVGTAPSSTEAARQTITMLSLLRRRAGRVIPACCAVDVPLGCLPA
jgi:hypothetical protein